MKIMLNREDLENADKVSELTKKLDDKQKIDLAAFEMGVGFATSMIGQDVKNTA